MSGKHNSVVRGCHWCVTRSICVQCEWTTSACLLAECECECAVPVYGVCPLKMSDRRAPCCQPSPRYIQRSLASRRVASRRMASHERFRCCLNAMALSHNDLLLVNSVILLSLCVKLTTAPPLSVFAALFIRCSVLVVISCASHCRL